MYLPYKHIIKYIFILECHRKLLFIRKMRRNKVGSDKVPVDGTEKNKEKQIFKYKSCFH